MTLIASGGFYLQDQPPFNSDKNDLNWREIPLGAANGDLRISHNNYNDAGADQDINCVFPLKRLRELAESGVIGGLTPVHFGFMGRIFSRRRLTAEIIPGMLGQLREIGTQLALLMPVWPLCDQTTGLIARGFEGAVLPTLTLSSALDIARRVRPPRSVFLNYPLGHTAGPPGEPEVQCEILTAAFAAGGNAGPRQGARSSARMAGGRRSALAVGTTEARGGSK